MRIFSPIQNPRSHVNRLHNIVDILLIGTFSGLCGPETCLQLRMFAIPKEEFFRKFLTLENGIPSEDTINRVFSAIDSDEFHFLKQPSIYETIELGHGRIEIRKCTVVSDFQFIKENTNWRN